MNDRGPEPEPEPAPRGGAPHGAVEASGTEWYAAVPMSTLRVLRQSLVDASARHSRVAHEIEDLAHDILLAALRRGTALEGEEFLRSIPASARRHASFLARSAGRRRVRESDAGIPPSADDELDQVDDDEATPVASLSPVLRTTLFLLVLGLEKAELRAVLGLTDVALRKRFQALREHAPLARPGLAIPVRTPALSRLRRSQVELLPRLQATVAADDEAGRLLAVGDPDGHGIIFAEALTPGRLTATVSVSAPNPRISSKGSPCSTGKSRTSPSSSSSPT